MDALDPENELIDRYLRGDLHGAQLETFKRKLETDPALKKDVEFRLLLVKGIQEHGAIHLKDYLRKRTSQKRGMIIGFRSWYYAAAAVGLVLISAGIVLYNMQGRDKSAANIAQNTESIGPPSTGQLDIAADSTSMAKNEPSPRGYINLEKEAEKEESKIDFAKDKSESNGAGTAEPTAKEADDVIVVASNIRVTPIRVDSPIETTMSTQRTAKPLSQSEAKRKKTMSDTAVYLSDEKLAEINDKFGNTNNTKFRLNFYNTQDARPQISAAKTSGTDSYEIIVYNLPYDNPIILTYQNKLYLKTGVNYYEIDPAIKGKQDVQPVTDAAILKALNQ